MHKYSEENEDNELFVFGETLGDGIDNDHFNLAFTCRKLISRMLEHNALKKAVFHIDSTFKIV